MRDAGSSPPAVSFERSISSYRRLAGFSARLREETPVRVEGHCSGQKARLGNGAPEKNSGKIAPKNPPSPLFPGIRTAQEFLSRRGKYFRYPFAYGFFPLALEEAPWCIPRAREQR